MARMITSTKNVIIYPLLLILLLPFALSAPPFEFEAMTAVGFHIITGSNDIAKYQQPYELYFHIHNASNGKRMNNTQVSCTIDFYNFTNGQHLFEGNLAKHALNDFEYIINYTQVTQVGTYTYFVECNDTHNGGFLRDSITFTNSGDTFIWEAYAPLFIFILLPLIISFLVMWYANGLAEVHSTMRWGLTLFSLVNVFFSIYFTSLTITKFYNWETLNNGFAQYTWIYGLVLLVLFSYWSIYLIVKAFDSARKAKMERMEY